MKIFIFNIIDIAMICYLAKMAGDGMYYQIMTYSFLAVGDFTGDDLAYIYPDGETAIVGKFENGILKAGREANVVAVYCSGGILQVKFSHARGPVLHYEKGYI